MTFRLNTFLVAAMSVLIASSAGATPADGQAHPTMTAIQIAEYGAPAVLQVATVPRPRPGEGELLVRVHAAAVNPVDAQIRSGPAANWLGVRLPYVPGFDLSGQVVELGPGVTGFSVGDAVYAMLDLRRGGAYAEYALVKAGEAAHKPARLTHEQAASLPLVALTAWQALFATADLQAGQRVLIHAAAGGVGSIAVQLAKWKGATVIATASADNHAFLRDLGADQVIDYRSQRFEDVVSAIDVVLDPIGGDTQARSLAVLKPGGILVSLNGLGPAAREAATRGVRAKAILVAPDADQLRGLAKLADGGALKPAVSHALPLEQASAAHDQIESRHTRGKVVLTLAR
jgi:NADPH:quinone reductase-like Zn-dependent oxidoreductase